MHRAIGAGALLAMSIGLSGCYAYGDGAEGSGPLAFCGILYACGNHGGSDNNNEPSPDSTSSASSSSSSSGSTGGEDAATTEGE
jgi:hypothetical protein